MPHLKPDPLGVPRNPFAVFLLCLALASGTITLLGTPASTSMEAALPELAVRTWGGTLAFGSWITLVGMYWQRDISTGLLMKRIGMLSLMIGASFYTITLLASEGIRVLFPASTVFCFGVAAFVQYRNINRRIRFIIEETHR